jgi:hypothetical protein
LPAYTDITTLERGGGGERERERERERVREREREREIERERERERESTAVSMTYLPAQGCLARLGAACLPACHTVALPVALVSAAWTLSPLIPPHVPADVFQPYIKENPIITGFSTRAYWIT